MTPNNNSQIQVLTNGWAEQLKADPTFTYSDAEELKGHLVDLCDELMAKGLTEEEAFLVASRRIGDFTDMKSEFEEVNTPIIQVRKAILVLSGVLTFFLLHYLMRFIITFLALIFYQLKVDQVLSFQLILQYLTAFHLIFIILTIIIYFRGRKVIENLKSLNVLPIHVFLIFLGVIVLAVIDFWFCVHKHVFFEYEGYLRNKLYTLYDYSSYSFPFIISICFLFLYKKYSRSSSNDVSNTTETNIACPYVDNESGLNEQGVCQLKELKRIGLEEEEALFIITKRKEMNQESQSNQVFSVTDTHMSTLMIIISGVLVYFFFHFLLLSTGKMFFSFLQYIIENNPIKNIIRTWSYIIVFQMICIFATVSLYFQDSNLIQLIKRINFKPLHTRRLFWIIFFLATLDRCFYPIYRNAAGHYSAQTIVYRSNISKVFEYTKYSLPIVICSCFLLLFYKYYRDNVKIG